MKEYYSREDDDMYLALDEATVFYHATRLEEIAASMLALARKIEKQVKYHQEKKKGISYND